MKRIMLTVAYDGTNYCGWQVQPNGTTIEGVLNQTISDLLHEDIKVIGASRTDSGVHAFGNVAVFDTNTRIPPDKLSYVFNQWLPKDICIQFSEEVSKYFHPRHCNSMKTYEYHILNRTFPIPTYRTTSHFVCQELNINEMKQAAAYFVGEHDFKSFCSIKSQVESTYRRIYNFTVEQSGDLIIIRVSGNGFLYNMVRILAGTLIEIGMGKYRSEHVKEMLHAKERILSGPTAPAKGLTLIGIEYEKELSAVWEVKTEEFSYKILQDKIVTEKKALIWIEYCDKDSLIDLIERASKQSVRNGAEDVYVCFHKTYMEEINVIKSLWKVCESNRSNLFLYLQYCEMSCELSVWLEQHDLIESVDIIDKYSNTL